MIENFKFKYKSRGKFIFVPNERSVRKGNRVISFFDKRVDFPDYFYHYRKGGHVAALHAHLPNRLFFKIDIQNFYYSITRMRVTRAMRSWGYPGAGTLAKWSCVANPYSGPKHVLPIGFVQSPLLASLVLMKSPVADAINRAISNGVTISVYLDDFIGSHSDEAILSAAFVDIRDTCIAAGLKPNDKKLVEPSVAITAFSCDLKFGSAVVKNERVEKYLAQPERTLLSDQSFELYRLRVQSQNVL